MIYPIQKLFCLRLFVRVLLGKQLMHYVVFPFLHLNFMHNVNRNLSTWFQEQGHWENSMNIFMGRPTTKSSTTPVYLHMHQLAVICNNHKLYLIRSLQCKETRITQFMERTLSIKEKREKKELGKYLFTQFSHIHLLINLIVGVYVIKYYKNVKLFA